MLNKDIEKALNDQINAELYSSYIYYSMSSYFQSVDLPGFANWMRVQALEELTHADKFFNYVVERNGRVELQKMDGPPVKWDSPLDALKAAHDHEHYISGRINDLVSLADAQNDRATYNFLQWFVAEQVEEETSTWEAVTQLQLAGEKGPGVFMLDREMAQRTFVPPAAEA